MGANELYKGEETYTLFFRKNNTYYYKKEQKGEVIMFRKNTETKESTIDIMRKEAMDANDYSTVRMLNEIEKEMQVKLLKERFKGMFGGYSSAMAGFTIGAVIVSQLKSREKA